MYVLSYHENLCRNINIFQEESNDQYSIVKLSLHCVLSEDIERKLDPPNNKS